MMTSSYVCRLFSCFILFLLSARTALFKAARRAARTQTMLLFIASIALGLSACGGGGGGGSNNGSTPSSVAPTILTQPQTVMTNVGEPATFTVAASGSSMLTYQWRRNGESIAGANQATYSIAETSLADHNATISVTVSNSAGTVTSSDVHLLVYAGIPFVNTNPVAQSATAGNAVTFNVVAYGTPPLSFQWRKYGVAIPGAIAASYQTPILSPSDDGAIFDVAVTNALGTVYSYPVTVSVTAVPGLVTIVTPPQSAALNEGDIASFSVTAMGTGPLVYQWRRNGIDIPGAYESTYRFVATHLHNSAQYSVQVSNATSATTSTAASLTVTPGSISLLLGPLGGYGNINGTADQARFSCPTGVVGDAAGNLYVVSPFNGAAVRKINPGGVVSTFAGSLQFVGSTDALGGSARFREPSGIAIDGVGNLYVTDSGNNTIRKITPAGLVTTVAGSAGLSGSADGTGSAARFNLDAPLGVCNHVGIAVDGSDNLYVADIYNHTIRKISAVGVVTTLAGSAGQAGLADGNGANARFDHPTGIAVDTLGNVVVTDSFNGKVRKIDTSGNVTTLSKTFGVANPGSGFQQVVSGIALDNSGHIYVSDGRDYIWRSDASGNFTPIAGGNFAWRLSKDGIGSGANLTNPKGIYRDSIGNVFIADFASIRKVSSDYRVSTVAGRDAFGISSNPEGIADPALLSFTTQDIAADSAGNIYAPYGNAIFKIAPSGVTSLFAGDISQSGSSDGVGSNARFSAPFNMAVDNLNNLYVADPGTHTIRKITPAGVVTTVAGSADQSGAQDGQGTAARFNTPSSIAVDAAGNLYVSDWGSHTIRKISPSGLVTTLAGTAGVFGSADGVGAAASFRELQRLTVDSAGNIYVIDGLSTSTIRKISQAGTVTTVGHYGSPSTDGNGMTATFASPRGITVDASDNVYVTDGGLIRKLFPDNSVTTVAGLPQSMGVLLGPLPGSLGMPQAIVMAPSASGVKLLVVDEGSVLSVTLP